MFEIPFVFFLGSTIIISSPVQPMLQNVMVPVSVMGQNTGKLTVLPNQVSNIKAYRFCDRIIVIFYL